MALPREHSYFSTCYNSLLNLQITNVYTLRRIVLLHRKETDELQHSWEKPLTP